MHRKLSIAQVLVLLGLFAATSAGAAVFMKISDIKGESTDTTDHDHEGWIVVESLSTSMNVAPSRAGTGTGATRRRSDAIVEDVSLTKHVDKASAKLAEAVCKGETIPKVEIHVTASYTDAGRQTYYKYELTNVMVTSYSVSNSGGSERPVENITLNFGEVKVTYDQQGMKSKGNVETEYKVGKGEK